MLQRMTEQDYFNKDYVLSKKIDRGNGCWEWTGYVDRQGYGRVKINRVCWGAHRLCWTIYNGPIENGLCVRHKCDNPRCINPAHLELGTVAENNADRKSRGRNYQGVNARMIELEKRVLVLEKRLKVTRLVAVNGGKDGIHAVV